MALCPSLCKVVVPHRSCVGVVENLDLGSQGSHTGLGKFQLDHENIDLGLEDIDLGVDIVLDLVGTGPVDNFLRLVVFGLGILVGSLQSLAEL